MGLYTIDCPQCKNPHMWFSGNLDQRCPACKKEETIKNYTIDNQSYFSPIPINTMRVTNFNRNFIQISKDMIINIESIIYVKILPESNPTTCVVRLNTGDSYELNEADSEALWSLLENG